ncbi:MAG: hypothetical protein NC048_05660 [Bacteroides sp.]|nr:hypothetical protein [Ruminococcus flavefaciens]MCM1554962.1 hypothetical protein [Bacteroides sp.]
MGENLIELEEMPVYVWIVIGLCVALIVAGIVLLATKSRRTRNKERFEINDGKVHKMRDLSFGFDTLHGREDEPEEEPEEEILPVFRQVDPAVQATPVGPYTSWDYKRNKPEKKQEASFAGFVQKTVAEPEAKMPAPAPVQQKPVVEEAGLQSVLMPEPKPAAKVEPKRQREPEVKAEAVSAQLPELNADEQLLLLKSHELLLTLTDGIKKVAAAKTDDSRKEKLSELMAAVKLLDAKSEWEEYKNCFEKIHPGFWQKLESISSEEMTPYELRLCALLSLGMATKDIAELTNRSVRTVETTIYKIRKKLNIESEDKTPDFLARLRSR